MKAFFIFLLLIIRLPLGAIEVDFDYIFVGSSPITLLEALYRSYTGSRVLVLEADSTIGGSWKTIDICGVSHADMGCHTIGSHPKIRQFLETHLGCDLVNMNSPCGEKVKCSDDGYYFSQGCYEITEQLKNRIEDSQLTLLLNHALKSVFLDLDRAVVEVTTNEKRFTASKLVTSIHSSFVIENFPHIFQPKIHKVFHLYLLIEDPIPAAFTYMNGFCKDMARIVNLTLFTPDLKDTEKQLIAIQLANENGLTKGEFFFNELKKNSYISLKAQLLQAEPYIYEQAYFDYKQIQKHPQASSLIEVMHTTSFSNFAQYVDKWEKAFCDYR